MFKPKLYIKQENGEMCEITPSMFDRDKTIRKLLLGIVEDATHENNAEVAEWLMQNFKLKVYTRKEVANFNLLKKERKEVKVG